jgi:hypothetical protein
MNLIRPNTVYNAWYGKCDFSNVMMWELIVYTQIIQVSLIQVIIPEFHGVANSQQCSVNSWVQMGIIKML